jgi:Uma2 family endonuclease
MSTAEKLHHVSVDEYLTGELESPVKHEYLGGVVYAMTGARNLHNLIATNAVVALGIRLRGKPCRPFNSDTKIRVRLPKQVRFYYPDASVICRSNPPTDSYQDEPIVLVEVISERTRRVDEVEKRDAYLSIGSLGVYLLVEQSRPTVIAYRRAGEGFAEQLYQGLQAVIPLPEIGIELPLAEIYEAVEFTPESD